MSFLRACLVMWSPVRDFAIWWSWVFRFLRSFSGHGREVREAQRVRLVRWGIVLVVRGLERFFWGGVL